ncbi:MAG: Wzz/FepE/Etk N-terminal domain-containing protein [Chloroflexota bacterium]|nr:Wzz/FepE/Etk N-terminal domain-containing protein [Chloroflexota bacterium]
MQLELRDYLNILTKRWWLILLVALSAGGGAYLYSRLQPNVYQASLQILVYPSRDDNGLIEALIKKLPSYAIGLQSLDFINTVLTDPENKGTLDDLRASDVLARMKVQVQPDTHTLQMTMDAPSGRQAADLANAVASAYADQQNALAQSSQSSDKIFLRQVDTARPPSQPYQPRPLLTAAAGGVLGLVLGLLLAFGLEFTDTSLRTSDDVQRFLALHTVGVIPHRR